MSTWNAPSTKKHWASLTPQTNGFLATEASTHTEEFRWHLRKQTQNTVRCLICHHSSQFFLAKSSQIHILVSISQDVLFEDDEGLLSKHWWWLRIPHMSNVECQSEFHGDILCDFIIKMGVYWDTMGSYMILRWFQGCSQHPRYVWGENGQTKG